MNTSPFYLLGGLFFTGVIGGGALLLASSDNGRPMLPSVPKPKPAAAAPASLPAAAMAQASPAPPAPDDPFVIKRILPITGPIRYGDWHWDDQDIPDGPLIITVDLDARVLSIFQGGYEIGATAVLLGSSEKPTPLGVFPIKWKRADHHSATYGGAPMPFTMNLTPDGVAIHGTTVEKGYASHGCIGVPTPFAKKLFAIVPVGTKVYVTKGKTAKHGDRLV